MNDTFNIAPLDVDTPAPKPHKNKSSKANKPIIGFRTASRLIAVQGLYAMELTKKRPSEIIQEITALHETATDAMDDPVMNEAMHRSSENFDCDYAVSLLHGVVREQRVIDPLICDTLPEKWTFNRLDKVMCSILRAGIYELLFSPDIPPKVIINEYTNIGSSFQLNDNNALINGVLNSVYHANHDIMG